ncbi:MFS transporter [uncultured Aquincola sp.]|uniref:MFS transporter n=1 Tax=uncultured Aquincola sp. TaxID=886556 RepID=UPI0032B1480C
MPPRRDAPAPHHDGAVTPDDIAVGVLVGRACEYFDFFVYGLASVLVFPALFFPHLERLDALLASFSVFALAFVARPIGTMGGMAIQRRYGRGVKLTVAMFGLGTATCTMALLPGTAAWGGAITALAACRVLQGLAIGAAWDGLPSLLAINAPAHRRGWYAMMGQLGAPVGFGIAATLFAYLMTNVTPEDFLAWGWRFPFFVAFALNVVALFARLQLVLDNDFADALRKYELEPCSLRELLAGGGGRTLAVGAFAALSSFALVHLVTVFPLSWLSLSSSRNLIDVLWLQVGCAVLGVGGMLVSGWLADRIGRRTTLGTLAVAIGLYGVATPWMLDGGDAGQNLFFLLGFALFGLSYAQAAGAVSSAFPSRLRYLGAALSGDLAWLFGAAAAPLVALYLSANYGLGAVSLYLLSGMAGTLLALSVHKRVAS